jgi:hypothetical protein
VKYGMKDMCVSGMARCLEVDAPFLWATFVLELWEEEDFLGV